MSFNKETLTVLGLGIILTAGVFFYIGWYNWEFKRPPTQVHHTQIVSGDNATVTQNPEQKKDRRLFTGVYGGRGEVGGVVGWLW